MSMRGYMRVLLNIVTNAVVKSNKKFSQIRRCSDYRLLARWKVSDGSRPKARVTLLEVKLTAQEAANEASSSNICAPCVWASSNAALETDA